MDADSPEGLASELTAAMENPEAAPAVVELTAEDLMQIFVPEDPERRQRLREGRRLVHYTTAEAGFKIIAGKEVWLRNALLMNDFSEIQYGLDCLVKAWNSEAGKTLQDFLDRIAPGLKDEIASTFDSHTHGLKVATFMISLSEHYDDEDELGRLSMWRAYGGRNGVAFTPLSSIEDLIDHQLGLTPTIPVGKFELRDRRFGIDIPLPMPVPTDGEWIGTLHAHPMPCTLRLLGPDRTELELSGDLIVSSLPGLPLEQCKLRVKADFFDLIHSLGGNPQFKLNFHSADKRTPMQLENLLRVMSWAGLGDIDVQVRKDGQRLFGGTADINPIANRAEFERLRILTGSLVQLSSDLRSASPMLSIEDLMAAEEQLVALYGFLTSDNMNVSAQVTADAQPAEIEQVLSYGFADVGNWRFGALTRWNCSEQAIEGGLWKFKLHNRHIEERYAFEASDGGAAGVFQEDFARLAANPATLVMDDNAVTRLIRHVR